MGRSVEEIILNSLDEGTEILRFMRQKQSLDFMQQAAALMATCLRRKGKLLIAGNGGSLCDAMHFAEELTGQFRKKRMPLAAIALSDPGHLTCTANDFGYEGVFSRAVEALGREGDLFIALTTSGNSKNLIEAASIAKILQLGTIFFLGKEGGVLRGKGDLEWIVPGFRYSDRIQEAHMMAIHIIIELLEKELFDVS